MTAPCWFSTKVRYAVLSETDGLRFYMDSILLFRSEDDWEDAFRRALDEGIRKEQAYENADGKRVVWKLASVISLDRIGEMLGDSQEVYSERVSAPDDQLLQFDSEFHPERSQPTQTF
jgi:uncharacterized protein DUF4288